MVRATCNQGTFLLQKGRSRLVFDNDFRKGVIALGRPSSSYDDWFDLDADGTAFHDPLTHLSPIVHAAFPVAEPAVGNTWGNQFILDKINATIDYMVDGGEFSSSSIHLLGISMGGLTALNYAKHYPENVISLSLIIPIIDVQAVHSGNRGGYAAAINSAYGGAPPDAYNPMDNTGDLADIPIEIYYSENDTITLESEYQQFQTETGCDLIGMGTASPHTWNASWQGLYSRNFFLKNEDAMEDEGTFGSGTFGSGVFG